MKSLLEIEIKDSDYENLGEFVYKYIDTLLEDKIPEDEEKNIARTLLDYQQYFESNFRRTVGELYSLIIYFCNEPQIQNEPMTLEVKNKLDNLRIYKEEFFQNIINIPIEKQQDMWEFSIRYSDNEKLPKELPEVLSITNLLNNRRDVLEFLDKYIVNQNLDIFSI